MGLVDLSSCGVLDGHDPLVVRDQRRERVSRVVLPEPVPPETRRLRCASMQRDRLDRLLGERADVDHVLKRGAGG